MLAISITHENAKAMAHRLRQFLAAGGTTIKQTHAYEALAKSLGYRDWNTLSATLQSNSTASDPDAAAPTASSESSALPAMLLLIDRHAMAAHAVSMTQIEAAFRREFPALLDHRSQWETLCHEQLPARHLPTFRPLVIAISLQTPEKAHFHDVLMERVRVVAEPKWTFGELDHAGVTKLTFMFFPEHDADQLLEAIRESLRHLPDHITVLTIEKVDPDPEHRRFGKWRTDGVSYFVWEWRPDPGLLLSEQLQIASLALKFNGDALVRLRDVATLHAGMLPPSRSPPST